MLHIHLFLMSPTAFYDEFWLLSVIYDDRILAADANWARKRIEFVDKL